MSHGDTGRGPVHRPAGAWVVADRPDAIARLLEAVHHAGMVPSVVTQASARATRDDEVPPVAVLLDAAAIAGSATAAIDRFHRIVPNAAIVVVTDHRPIRWLTTGATVALPADTSATAIALQLRNLHALSPERGWEETRRYGPFVHDPARASLRAAGTQVRCSTPLTALLLRLLCAEGRVVPVAVLHRALQRTNPGDVTDVRAHVRRLRACLDRTAPGLGTAIVTVRGVGYRLDLERAARACEGSVAAHAGDSASSRAQGDGEHSV